MLEIYQVVEDKLIQVQEIAHGTWVNLVCPGEEEINRVASALNIPQENLRAALDEEERPRMEREEEEGQTLILIDTPYIEKEDKINVYTTLPLGLILTKECFVTVCLKEDTILKHFIGSRVKGFNPHFKNRFVLQLLYRNAAQFLLYLRHIDRLITRLEEELQKSMRNRELFQLLKLQKSLIYFSTSLKSNELVLNKLLKLDFLQKYPDDTDLLEDVIIENRQAIEMTNIYSGILSGISETFASIVSNNLNMVMKFLTSVTILLALPTMFSSFFGMNVRVPGQDWPFSFGVIAGISLAVVGLAAFLLARRKMF